jgi:hypothetical protein
LKKQFLEREKKVVPLLKKCRKDVAFNRQLRTNTRHRKSLTTFHAIVNEFLKKKATMVEGKIETTMICESLSDVGGGNRLKTVVTRGIK